MMSMKFSKMTMRVGMVCGVVLAGLVLAGCGGGSKPLFEPVEGLTEAPASNQAATASAPARAAAPESRTPTIASTAPGAAASRPDSLDRLSPKEMVVINFTDLPQPVQPTVTRIREDGTVTLLQNLTFNFAGKMTGDLEKEIHDTYVPKYYKTMTVQVMHQPETQFYYVGGEVKLPGRQVYISAVTVLGAIKTAGDYTDFANRSKIRVTRADGRILWVNGKKALEDPRLDLEVYPGDNITVKKKNPFAF